MSLNIKPCKAVRKKMKLMPQMEIRASDGVTRRALQDSGVKPIKMKVSKKKKKDLTSRGTNAEVPRSSSVPLSIIMPSSNRRPMVSCFPSCSKSFPNVSTDQPKSLSKYRIPKKSISSSFKVTTVPSSTISNPQELQTKGTKFECGDGSSQDVPRACRDLDDNNADKSPLLLFEENDVRNGNVCSNVKIHNVFGNIVLHLKHPVSFPFCGQLQVDVIKGAVEVLGYILTPSKGSHTVFCPRGSCLLPLQTTVPVDRDLCNMSCMDVDATQVTSLIESGGENDAWLLLRKVENILPIFLDKYFPFKLFPTPDLIEREESFLKASRKLNCLFDIPVGSKCFMKGEKWDTLHTVAHKSDCTVLCGGKGVGKSTLMRFLVNKLLQNGHNAVCILDFDPGQAELTVPGCVSASVVSKPLLGPNFTHLQKTERCIYLGEVNVSNCVTRYMDACVNIINFWRTESALSKMPCIVNTMGFNRGLGVTLMVQLLSFLKPNLVIQLQSETVSHNFPNHLSVDYVTRNCSSVAFTSDLDAHLFSSETRRFSPSCVSYDLLVLRSITDTVRQRTLGPRQLREIVILSYLSQAVSSPSYSILDIVPFSCPLNSMYLNVCHESVDPSLLLSVMNGSLVALSHIDCNQKDVVQASTIGAPAVITKPLIADCYGFGVVRGIDMDTNYLYVSTPLKIDELSYVNCLMLGAVNLPPAILLNLPKDSGAVPYVAVVQRNDVAPAAQSFDHNPIINDV